MPRTVSHPPVNGYTLSMYGGYYTASDVHVLLKTDHPKNDPELAWTKTYGKSRAFYLMLGHDRHAWENPNFPKILLQGLRWAAGK